MRWKTVLWSDEFKFEILFENMDAALSGLKRRLNMQLVQKSASLMVWGCIGDDGIGTLHIWKGTINVKRYTQV